MAREKQEMMKLAPWSKRKNKELAEDRASFSANPKSNRLIGPRPKMRKRSLSLLPKGELGENFAKSMESCAIGVTHFSRRMIGPTRGTPVVSRSYPYPEQIRDSLYHQLEMFERENPGEATRFWMIEGINCLGIAIASESDFEVSKEIYSRPSDWYASLSEMAEITERFLRDEMELDCAGHGKSEYGVSDST